MRKWFGLVCFSVLLLVSQVSYADEVDSENKSEIVLPSAEEENARLEAMREELEREILEFEKAEGISFSEGASFFGVGYNGFGYLDGDILVTKSTSSVGLTGHVGIVCGNGVVHITPNRNSGHPELISMNTWFANYPKNIVIRYKGDREVPKKAAWYAKSFYVNGDGYDNDYRLTHSLYSRSDDYCSSLVWKCYHYGANFDFKVLRSHEGYVIPGMVVPYDYIENREFNNFSAVHSVKW